MDAPFDDRAPASAELSAGTGPFAIGLLIVLFGSVLLAIFAREPSVEPVKERVSPVVTEPDPRPARRY